MRHKYNLQIVNPNKFSGALQSEGAANTLPLNVCSPTSVSNMYDNRLSNPGDGLQVTNGSANRDKEFPIDRGLHYIGKTVTSDTICKPFLIPSTGQDAENNEDVPIIQYPTIVPGQSKEKHVQFCTSSPVPFDPCDSNDGLLTIHIPQSPVNKKRKRYKEVPLDMNKEIEQEIEHQLEKKAQKTNLTVANVKSILKHVIGNEDVLAMVERSMQTSFSDRTCNGDATYDLKLTRAKTKELLQAQPAIMWPLTPVKKIPDSEHLLLINQELGEESDDEEYRPNFDDFHEQSDEETGRHSVVSSISYTSTLNTSIGQFFESFDPKQSDKDSEPHFAVPDNSTLTSAEENIGQRTRSKLCLSDTPLETIEQAFVPPDITTDMYESKCDNVDWENFLKDFMQPLSNEAKDDDEEADPEYNVLADVEEEVDKEELRRDKAVTISRKELRKLMAELFECPDDMSSDEEEELRVQSEISKQLSKNQQEEIKGEKSEDVIDKSDKSEQMFGVTASQKLLLEQQLRQHIQFTTQHFLQTYKHPVHGRHAQTCKVTLATLVELGRLQDNSIYNVYNLHKAFTLVEKWEKYLSSEKGAHVVRHITEPEKWCKRRQHDVTFHPDLMRLVVESDVFMYSLLLPDRPFRYIDSIKFEFVPSEDGLIALGLEEFSAYIAENPRWFDRKKCTEKAAAEVMCEFLVRGKTADQVMRRIRTVKCLEGNPIKFYRENGRAPGTTHFVISLNSHLTQPPCLRPREMLPPLWRRFVYPELETINQPLLEAA